MFFFFTGIFLAHHIFYAIILMTLKSSAYHPKMSGWNAELLSGLSCGGLGVKYRI